MIAQQRLIPDKQPKTVPGPELPAARLIGWQDCPEPDSSFVESVRRFGVIQPVVVTGPRMHPARGEVYDIVDGRRRSRAANIVGAIIPTVLLQFDGDAGAAVYGETASLVANFQRSANVISELRSIERLVQSGAGEREIAGATGMAVATIRERLRLRRVPAAIMDGLVDGRVKLSTALAISKLNADEMTALADHLRETGRITGNDVASIRRVERLEELETLSLEVMPECSADWTPAIRERLAALLDIIPESSGVVRHHIAQALEAIGN